jgi:3-deoxy-D-manno-octulosonic-acid transferase
VPTGASIFLLDTLGELDRFYAICDIAIIGKSFPGPHEGGGHNPLEAAAKGKAVVSGPRVHNFKWMFNALAANGAAEIVGKQDLEPRLRALLEDPELLRSMGQKGREFILSHRGSAQRTLAHVLPTYFGEMVEADGAPAIASKEEARGGKDLTADPGACKEDTEPS